MLHRSPHPQNRARDPQRKVTPPGPSYMSNDQIASYLKDLRTNRPTRPGGSRPLPTRPDSASKNRDDLPPRATSAMSAYGHSRATSAAPTPEAERPRAASSLSNHRPVSFRSSFGSSYGSSAGRPLVQEPRLVPLRKNVSPSRAFSRIPSGSTAYRESLERRREKEEAKSLRDALQEMDIQDEIRIHGDAQDEATELVWMHQNPGIPFKNPHAPYRNPDMDEQKRVAEEQNKPQQERVEFRSSWRNSNRFSFKGRTTGNNSGADHASFGDESPMPKNSGIPKKNLKVNFALPREAEKTDGDYELGLVGASNDPSKGIFRNPKDQIYEEPHDYDRNDDDERHKFSMSDSSALRTKTRNALPQGSRPLPSRFGSIPFVDKLSRFELHKHPPTQSRKPDYKTNTLPSPPTADASQENSEPIRAKDGLEIRSDDIRAATSKKRSDRSSKLPMPTAVSDRTGRPIVSFDPSWKPTETKSPAKRELPEIQVSQSAPPPPAIEVSEPPSVPVINLPDEKEPTIAEMDHPSQNRKQNPQPPSSTKDRRRSSSGLRRFMPSQDRWMSTYSRAGVPTATCESCSLPIAGRVVTAAGSRFHTECFTCHHCQTPLECVAFYQEPDAKRNERLADPSVDEEAHAPRFYCHLDFHELFSPRCKSCKTPVEGEVVVACGAEWHVGHFFCAECGDPFNSDTPFVEKDGFAWCLQCHSRRTAPSCAGCKKPILDDVVISAVGGKWHDKCFVCHECGEGFGREGRYFVREGEPRRTAKGRIIGGPVQLAVCEKCEGIRLKASPRA
ncbi:LIM domain protein [Aspergillus lucknowensis]|uniref:LIM zinc-binding domain-containing protein n=1 Tax=Aspergillus lucknowensis TaxID=176173 RepID=A0ABR4LM72_9EURO